jgi:hypothetical protein
MFDPYLPLTLFGLAVIGWQVMRGRRALLRKQSDP